MSETTGYNTSSGGADPITAIANAAGDIFKSVFGFLSMGKAAKIEKTKLQMVQELTVQERIKYDQLIRAGNSQMALMLLEESQERQRSQQSVIYLIVAGVLLSVILTIIFKNRRK